MGHFFVFFIVSCSFALLLLLAVSAVSSLVGIADARITDLRPDGAQMHRYADPQMLSFLDSEYVSSYRHVAQPSTMNSLYLLAVCRRRSTCLRISLQRCVWPADRFANAPLQSPLHAQP